VSGPIIARSNGYASPVGEESPQAQSERLAETTFLGGPPADFERVGRLGFEVLLREGLLPSSRVLDVGCGALRVGYWLMRFLDSGCYFGIEPNREMLRVGLEELLEPEVVQRAEAHFSHNDDFDFSVFGERFDFVFARSIWTHASKPQIHAMLASFAATSAPGGVFLASYHPASALFPLGRRSRRLAQLSGTAPIQRLSAAVNRLPAIGGTNGYAGEEWVGRSHRSAEGGVVRHSLRWIEQQGRELGLTVQLMPYEIVNDQYWLRIQRGS
jgi:SAM-dependent methyltransferase